MAAVVRTIRGWDYGLLTPEMVRRVLDEELALLRAADEDSRAGGTSERRRTSTPCTMSLA